MKKQINHQIRLIFVALILLSIHFSYGSNAVSKFQIIDLRCESFSNPLGIGVTKPRLGWNIETSTRNWMQSSYQIIVASDSIKLSQNIGDLWNSGRVKSNQNLYIEYGGNHLKSRQLCWWKVKVWDNKGFNSTWSAPQCWKMGILTPDEWRAKWICSDIQLKEYQKFLRGFTDFGMEPETEIWDWATKIRKITDTVENAPAVYLRKTFDSQKKVQSAFVSVCGLGLYKLYLNGQRIGNSYLDPAFSDYQKRVYYSTYDVTQHIQHGENSIGTILGNGWYNLIIPHALRYYAADYIAPPKLLLELNITYTDGSVKTVSSDSTWKYLTDGPIQFNCLLGGETYDANKEITGWDRNGFNDKNWKTALSADAPEGRLMPQKVYPVIKAETYPAKSIKFKDQSVVVDFGKELTGWCRMKIKGKKGEAIIIKYPGSPGHTLGRYQTCKYVFKGDKEEVYEPRFCYNGFQTVEITGLDYQPDLNDFTAQVVCTVLPVVGSFECSNEKFNRLQDIIIHTIKNYVVHIPNDPTREKAGWTQDVETAFDVTAYNFDCAAMYCKWQQDFLDIQHNNGYVPPVVPSRFDGQTINGPWWGGMIVYLPWKIYQNFADLGILEESYPAMKKQVDYLTSISDNHIIKWGLGDWMEPGSVRPVKTPVPLTSTIAFYYFSNIVSQTAHLLGKTEDEKKYAVLAGDIKKSYNQTFLNDKTGEYALGSQASQLLSLTLRLVPADKEKIVRQALLRRIEADSMHLSTGFVATPFLLNGLTDLGYPKVAYTMATQNTYPSWFDMVFNHGNTVLKEAWDGGLVQMPSLAGPIGSWFYSSLAGIKQDPSIAGFKKIIIDPISDTGLSWAKGSYKSIQGNIISSWKRENGTFTLNVKIPANTQAKVYLPTTDIQRIYENGISVMKNKDFGSIYLENGKTIVLTGSGNYAFTIKE